MSFAIAFNTFFAKRLPMVEGLVLIIQIFGFIAIVVTLWAMAPRNSVQYTLVDLQNNGGWDNLGVTFLVGMITPLYSLLGADGVVHMCEEIKDTAVVTPKAIMAAIGLNGALGFIMMITFIFTLDDSVALLTTPSGYPFIQVFYNVTGSFTGVSLLTSILIVTLTSACISNLATASRQLWSFSRDKGLPFSSTLAYVRPGMNIPLNAVLTSLAITIILSCINIGSTVALNALTAASVSYLLPSYILPIGCLLLKRIRGEQLPPRRWSLGRYGAAINAVGLLLLCVMFVMSFFPIGVPVVASTMNWNVVIYCGVVIPATIYYVLYARHKYVGPVELIKKGLRAQGCY
jgi:choline transport protein